MKIVNFEEYSIDFKDTAINEWNSFDPNNEHNHVYVYGAKDGQITEDGEGLMVFDNIENAKETFKDLDPKKSTKKFTHAYNLQGLNGVMVFATWKKINMRNNYK